MSNGIIFNSGNFSQLNEQIKKINNTIIEADKISAIAEQIENLESEIGSRNELVTTEKETIVGAINEIAVLGEQVSSNTEAINKINNEIGVIDTALTNIIELQESYIHPETEEGEVV